MSCNHLDEITRSDVLLVVNESIAQRDHRCFSRSRSGKSKRCHHDKDKTGYDSRRLKGTLMCAEQGKREWNTGTKVYCQKKIIVI